MGSEAGELNKFLLGNLEVRGEQVHDDFELGSLEFELGFIGLGQQLPPFQVEVNQHVFVGHVKCPPLVP